MAGPLPGGKLPTWAKFLLQKVPWIDIGLQYAVQYIDNLYVSDDPTPTEWRRMQVVWKLAGNSLVADHWTTTQDFINLTNGQIDNTWNAADYDEIYTAFLNFHRAGIKPYQQINVQLIELRFYRMVFAQLPNPDPVTGRDRPFVKSGPPIYVYPLTETGGDSTNAQAPQVAVTTTDKTSYRKHWGRNYWPGFASDNIDASTGHIPGPVVVELGTQYAAYLGGLWNLEKIPVTPVTQIDKQPARGLLSVTSVQVDNVPDVVRRRRPRTTTYRYISP